MDLHKQRGSFSSSLPNPGSPRNPASRGQVLIGDVVPPSCIHVGKMGDIFFSLVSEWYQCICSSSSHLLSPYCVPGSTLGPGNWVANQTMSDLAEFVVFFWGGTDIEYLLSPTIRQSPTMRSAMKEKSGAL